MNDNAVTFIGFDGSLLGFGCQYTRPVLAVYSEKKILQELEDQGMSPSDAVEYYYHNIRNAWMGDGTPMIIEEGPHEPMD